MKNQSIAPYYKIPGMLWEYDDSKICGSAKLLYPLLVSLSKNKGFCYATNKYLGKIMKRSTSSISKFVKQLSDEGFIRIKITRNNTMRLIYIVPLQEVRPQYSDEQRQNIQKLDEVSSILLFDMKQNFKSNR